jgi:hypothetical protein
VALKPDKPRPVDADAMTHPLASHGLPRLAPPPDPALAGLKRRQRLLHGATCPRAASQSQRQAFTCTCRPPRQVGRRPAFPRPGHVLFPRTGRRGHTIQRTRRRGGAVERAWFRFDAVRHACVARLGPGLVEQVHVHSRPVPTA